MTAALWPLAVIAMSCTASYAVWAAWDYGKRRIALAASKQREDERMAAIEAKAAQIETLAKKAVENLATEMLRAIGAVALGEQPINERVKRLEQARSNVQFAQGHQSR